MRPIGQTHHRLKRLQLGIGNGQAGDALGVLQGKSQGNPRPVAMPDDMRPLLAKFGQKLAKVFGKLAQQIAGLRHRAGAMTAQVMHQHGPIRPHMARRAKIPKRKICPKPMNKGNRHRPRPHIRTQRLIIDL